MKIARYTHNGVTNTGIIDGEFIYRCVGEIYSDDYSCEAHGIELCKVRLEVPSLPTKIVAVGKNYSEHIKEVGGEIPKNPILFIKPTTCLISQGEEIVFPEISKRVDHEAELCFVIKKTAKKVKKENYKEYILGYSCMNDVTARDIQALDGQWTRAKGYDTFAPYGPWIVTDIDPNNQKIEARVNGIIRQSASTSMFIWNIGEILEFITEGMTLLPGDVVTTGTPSGISQMNKGDIVEIEIEDIGILKNMCK